MELILTTDDGLIPALVYDPAEDGIMRAYVSTGSYSPKPSLPLPLFSLYNERGGFTPTNII
jgi:hypothetical protein